MFYEEKSPQANVLEPCTSTKPTRLAEFIGQARLVETLEALVSVARTTAGRHLPNSLLIGPKGSGKRLLATMVAHELAVPVRTVRAHTIGSDGDLVNVLAEIQAGELVILENVHRLPVCGQLRLAAAMALGKIPTDDREGWNEPPLAPCAIVATASAAEGSVVASLRERFPAILRLAAYSRSELRAILDRLTSRADCQVVAPARGKLLRVAQDDAGAMVQMLDACCRLAKAFACGIGQPVILPRHVETVLATSGFDILGSSRFMRTYLAGLRTAGDKASRRFIAALRWPRELVNQVEQQLVETGLVRMHGSSVELTKAARGFLHEDE